MNQIIYISFCIFIGLNISSAQNADGMVINKIEGNSYIRKKFDSKNNLINYQIFEAGKIFQKNNDYILPITINSYEKDGKLKDKNNTSYKCNPENKEMLIAVLPLIGKSNNTKLKVTDVSSSQLYPNNLKGNVKLDDYYFTLNIEGGLAGFFGTRSKVVLTDRSVKQVSSNEYSFTGAISIKSYAWGVNISTLKYRLTEKLDLNKGIVYQKMVESSGDYFTLELK